MQVRPVAEIPMRVVSIDGHEHRGQIARLMVQIKLNSVPGSSFRAAGEAARESWKVISFFPPSPKETAACHPERSARTRARSEEPALSVAKGPALRGSDLPIRKQHALSGMPLRIAFVGHPQIGPPHAVAAGDQTPERVRVAALAADRDAANARLGGGRFD